MIEIWVARDSQKDLTLFEKEPKIDDLGEWNIEKGFRYVVVNDSNFSNVEPSSMKKYKIPKEFFNFIFL